MNCWGTSRRRSATSGWSTRPGRSRRPKHRRLTTNKHQTFEYPGLCHLLMLKTGIVSSSRRNSPQSPGANDLPVAQGVVRWFDTNAGIGMIARNETGLSIAPLSHVVRLRQHVYTFCVWRFDILEDAPVVW